MSGFTDSIVAGIGSLIRTFIKSPNFVTGVSGWSINKDGSAEFNNVTVRGTVEVDASVGLGKVLIDGTGWSVFDSAGSLAASIHTTDATNDITLKAINVGADQFFLPFSGDPLNNDFSIAGSGVGFPIAAFWDSAISANAFQFFDNSLVVPFVFMGSSASSPRADGALVIPGGLQANVNKSNAATVATAAELKDGGVGDLTFDTYSGRTYRIRYSARCRASAVPTTMDIYIRAALGASPTTASTIYAATSVPIGVAAGAGATTMVAEAELRCPTDIAAGNWTMAGFYSRTAGAGNVNVDQAGGQNRTLSVTDVGVGV